MSEFKEILGTVSVDTGTLFISDPGSIQEHWKIHGDLLGYTVFGDDVFLLTEVFVCHLTSEKEVYMILLDEHCPTDREFRTRLNAVHETYRKIHGTMPELAYVPITNNSYALMREALKNTKAIGTSVPFEITGLDGITHRFPLGVAIETGYDGGYDVVLVRGENGQALRIEIDLT